MALFKTKVIIWSSYDPESADVELAELVRDAENGDEALCSHLRTHEVLKPEDDPDWNGITFEGGTD